jgi:hypothetical protein
MSIVGAESYTSDGLSSGRLRRVYRSLIGAYQLPGSILCQERIPPPSADCRTAVLVLVIVALLLVAKCKKGALEKAFIPPVWPSYSF